MNIRSQHKVFGGTLQYMEHDAMATHCPMRFSIFLPPQHGPRPTLFFLSGLTCTEENFTVKAGAYRVAAELGLIIVAPDTSPRGRDVPDADREDLGWGAGFYLNATEPMWAKHYRMEDYIVHELHALIVNNFPTQAARMGIFGHSMGGHGALTLFQRHPGLFHSLSAFAPICAPSLTHGTGKALGHYLGENRAAWEAHDASALMRASGGNHKHIPILIDQGTADSAIGRLRPQDFADACAEVGQPLELRYQEGYDHAYFFVQSFIDDHLRFHARQLG